MRRSIPPAAALALLLAALPSCATLVADSPTSLKLTSEPPGLAFTTDYGQSGLTPAMLLPPPRTHRVALNIQRPGEAPKAFVLRRRKSFWLAGNLILWGPLGLLVDIVNPGTCVWPENGEWHIVLD